MNDFLGILFCGGRGRRLGEITKYISKAFVPVFDRPVFRYPLAQLEASQRVAEILVLSNDENDQKLRQTGHRTLVQDDRRVRDMFTGLAFIREVTGDERPAVLMPCDNISEICVDDVISVFLDEAADIAINVRKIDDRDKLREMGVFDPKTGQMEYRPKNPKTDWGVLAPYVVATGLDLSAEMPEVLRLHRSVWREYDGVWFDVGDVGQLAAANAWCSSVVGSKCL